MICDYPRSRPVRAPQATIVGRSGNRAPGFERFNERQHFAVSSPATKKGVATTRRRLEEDWERLVTFYAVILRNKATEARSARALLYSRGEQEGYAQSGA